MVRFKQVIKKFSSQGEKTGWTYVDVPADIAQKLKPGTKRSFRVKVHLDEHCFEGIALLPMGEGNFIMAINASMRKALGKRKGAMITVEMEPDNGPVALNADLVKCLNDEPLALAFFNSLAAGHRRYFSNWVESAKTENTRATRIAHTVTAMIKKQDFGAMAREIKNERKFLGRK